MKEKTIAYVKESFDITNIGIVVEIKHIQGGLPKSTKLTSSKTGLSWMIVSRVLFDHAVDRQLIFENEAVDYMRLSFQTVEKKDNSIQKIVKSEAKGIFQYLVKPMNHNSKPFEEEELRISIAL